MTTLSDAIRAVVGGTSNNDGLMAYYAANGGVGTTLPDLERSFLISQLGLSAPVSATTNDLWRQFLAGFTGSLPDQLLQFWLAGGAVESWTPAEWFLANEKGIWFDPSDFSTMFQDSAGTTPVTAVEQPVGKILDKSGRGNHASQSTAASRPVLSARKNKLLATTTLATQVVTLTASPHTLSFKGTGTVTLSGASTAGPLVGTGASNRVSLTFTPTAGSVTFTVSGSVTEAQLENGSTVGTYQRVTTATDYDTVGFPHYLKFDGVDDFLTSGSIDFTATDKMTVVAGVLKGAAAEGIIAELSTQYNLNNGSFALQSRASDTSTLFIRGGTATSAVSSASNFPVGALKVITATSSIASNWQHIIRHNGVQDGIAANNVGTSNFYNYPLYIGRRGGTSSPFNGNIHQLIVRGTATPLADIQSAEAFTAGKTGVTLP